MAEELDSRPARWPRGSGAPELEFSEPWGVVGVVVVVVDVREQVAGASWTRAGTSSSSGGASSSLGHSSSELLGGLGGGTLGWATLASPAESSHRYMSVSCSPRPLAKAALALLE